MKFDIPINISVDTTTEKKSRTICILILKNGYKEFGVETKIINWEYFEFLSSNPVVLLM